MRKIAKHMVLTMLVIILASGTFHKVADAAAKLATPEISVSNVAKTGKIKVKWNAVENAVSYKVYRSTDGKTWKELVATKNTSITNTSAVAGKKYYYKVKAIAANTANNSAFSKVKYRTCDLARPEMTLSTKTETGKTIISWNKISKAVSYKLYRSKDNKNWILMKTTGNTSFVHTGAKAGTKHYYKVRAIASNINANSAYSTVKYRICREPYEMNTYEKEVVELAKKIEANWKTTYVQGETGAKNADGAYQFDCSGFTTYVINKVMVKYIPPFRMTSSLSKLYALDYVYNEGYPGECAVKTVSLNTIRPGDVLFFSHHKENDHCGIYIGNNKFIHCTKSKGGVVLDSLTGTYERDFSAVRRYLPEKVTPANTKKTIAKSCSLYSKRENDNSKIKSLSSGTKVTVLFTGNSPESYNQAYVKTSDGTKGFIYAKNLK